jgi:glutathione S-transferase
MTSTNPQPKITLYRGWDTLGQYVWSPFVTKLEFRLRTSLLPYTCASGSPSSGPKGKIPYIEVETDASRDFLADSSLILKTFSDQGLITDINAKLSPKDRGIDLAIRALLEDKLNFYHAHERWIKNYYTMRDHTMHSIPYLLRPLIGLLAYRGNVQKLHDQGTGRFSDPEIRGFIEEVWTGISGMLEESRRQAKGRDAGEGECYWVLGGEEPTEADATLFGFVNSVLISKAGPESTTLLRVKFPTVVEYAERIHGRWFPDYEIWE